MRYKFEDMFKRCPTSIHVPKIM